MFDCSGKTLLLTGANGGITRAIARTFHELGANLVLTDLDEAGVKGFGAELDGTGKRVVALKGDVTQSADADAAVALCQARFGGIDYLVTGAWLYLDQLVET